MALIPELDDFLCKTCGHRAVKHTAHVGPCAECWELLQVICEHFELKDEDVAIAENCINILESRLDAAKGLG